MEMRPKYNLRGLFMNNTPPWGCIVSASQPHGLF